MRYILSIFICVFCVTISTVHAEDVLSDAQKGKAIQAAEDWLEILDDNKIDESWFEMSSYFREKISMSRWSSLVSPLRNRVGEVVTRDLLGTYYRTEIPDAPKGDYLIMQYKSVFKNPSTGKSLTVTEIITSMKDNDAEWRVGGYYIK